MQFVSTRGGAPPAGFSEAMVRGLAPDGGLYIPERFPLFDPAGLAGAPPLPELAARVLAPFFEGDPLAGSLGEICREAFDFEVPLVFPADRGDPAPAGPVAEGRFDGPALRGPVGATAILELFHGPTAAFKDLGARFMAACLSRVPDAGAGPRTVLVATSGDTGGAVAAAFHGRPGIEVGILFPKGGVSGRQERQLTAWGGNVRAFAVTGTFDDCQRVLKEAFADDGWRQTRRLTTANSINIARLLPQTVYYASTALAYRRARGVAPGFVVPSGNAGNVTAAFWARAMGFPVGDLVLAANANRTLPDFFASGRWEPRPSVATLANAMDVGDPSNMERLLALYPDAGALRAAAESVGVNDATIRRVIAEGPPRWGRIWDPHTATAVFAREQVDSPDWVIVSTAHPAKFETIVEPLVGVPVPVPPALAAILARPGRCTEVAPELADFERAWG
jgi:threonine synthase